MLADERRSLSGIGGISACAPALPLPVSVGLSGAPIVVGFRVDPVPIVEGTGLLFCAFFGWAGRGRHSRLRVHEQSPASGCDRSKGRAGKNDALAGSLCDEVPEQA